MIRLFRYTAACCFLSTTLLSGCSTLKTPIETVYIPELSLPGWKTGYANNQENEAVVEFIPAGETIKNWSQIYTIQFMKGIQVPLETYAGYMMGVISQQCQEVSSKEIEQNKTSVLFEWDAYNCKTPSIWTDYKGANGSQHEIARILVGNDGLHRIAYTQKDEAIPETIRATMIKSMQSAYVEKDGEPVVLKK